MGAEAVGVEGAVVVEGGEREGQHTLRHTLPQPPCHVLRTRIAIHADYLPF